MIKSIDLDVRWMIRRDLPEVLAIDEVNNKWDSTGETEMLKLLRGRTEHGLVATVSDKIVGFVIYQVQEKKLLMLKFEVDPAFMATKVPQELFETMKKKAKKRKCEKLEIVVSDRSEYINVHKFWASMGLKSRLKRNFFGPQVGDGYEFTWNCARETEKDESFGDD